MSSSRRDFLRLVGAHLAAAPLASIPFAATVGCGPPPPPEWESLARRAAAWFRPEDLPSARRIGAHFLGGVGRAREMLEPELAPTLARLMDGSIDGAIDEVIDRAIEADFAAYETRRVRGWVLAATEAHLCALVELFGVTAD